MASHSTFGRLLCTVGSVVAVILFMGSPVAAHGDLHERLAAIDAEIAAHPQDAELHLRRALLLLAHEQSAEALIEVERAAALAAERAAECPGIDGVRGRVLAGLHRWDEALTCLDRHLAISTTDLSARLARVDSLIGLGRSVQAVTELDAALALRFDGDVAIRRARLLVELGRTAAAIDSLDTCLQQEPRSIVLDQAAFDLEHAAGLTTAAVLRARRLSATLPTGPSFLRLGDALQAAGDSPAAQQAWREAMAWIDGLPAHRQGASAVTALRETVGQRLHPDSAITDPVPTTKPHP